MKNNPDVVGLFYDLQNIYRESGIYSDVLEYSAETSQTYALEQERNVQLDKTEKVIKEISKQRNARQLRRFLQRQSVEVRYFILERAMLIIHAYMKSPDFQPSAKIVGTPYQKISQGLIVLWEQFRDFLSREETTLNDYLSQAIHRDI